MTLWLSLYELGKYQKRNLFHFRGNAPFPLCDPGEWGLALEVSVNKGPSVARAVWTLDAGSEMKDEPIFPETNSGRGFRSFEQRPPERVRAARDVGGTRVQSPIRRRRPVVSARGQAWPAPPRLPGALCRVTWPAMFSS